MTAPNRRSVSIAFSLRTLFVVATILAAVVSLTFVACSDRFTAPPPMSEADLTRIESALGYALPPHYRKFMLQHGEELRQIELALPLRTVLYLDPDEMIHDNEFSRTGDVFRLGEEQHPWPENYLLVASNGGGDFWYVHRDVADTGIWFWSHESCEIERVSPSLDDYLETLRADLKQPAEWQLPGKSPSSDRRFSR